MRPVPTSLYPFILGKYYEAVRWDVLVALGSKDREGFPVRTFVRIVLSTSLVSNLTWIGRASDVL